MNAHSNSQDEKNQKGRRPGRRKKLNQIQWMAIIIHPKRPRGPGKKNKETNGNVFLIINLIISKRKCIQSLEEEKLDLQGYTTANNNTTLYRRKYPSLRVYLGCCCCLLFWSYRNKYLCWLTYVSAASRQRTDHNQSGQTLSRVINNNWFPINTSATYSE